MKINDIILFHCENDTNDKVQVSIFDENLEEKIIDIKDICKDSDGNTILDISEEISEILIKHENAIFRRCLDNTPKSLQTKETVELLSTMFGYKKV